MSNCEFPSSITSTSTGGPGAIRGMRNGNKEWECGMHMWFKPQLNAMEA